MTTDSPTHQCRVCGVPIAMKRGAPRQWCDAHAPARRAYMAAWQAANGAALRRRLGHRALVAAACSGCGVAFNTYKAFEQCSACRQLRVPR
jgi:hypothetical protein